MIEHCGVTEYPKLIAAFQGIGEPSLVASEVLNASLMIRQLDARNVVSISTTGTNLNGVHMWREAHLPISVLQFSVTATSDSSHKQITPRVPNFDALLKEIILCTESASIEVVNVNYILLRNINDSVMHIEYLARIFSGTRVRFRVASLNATSASNRFRLAQASKEEAIAFAEHLLDKGVNASVFGAFNDTNVSCGQLSFTKTRRN